MFDMLKLLRSKKAISPILATLLLIMISVAGIVVSYSWIQSFMGNQLSTASGFILIENVRWYDSNKIDITIRNSGNVDMIIKTLYIDGLGHELEQSVKPYEAETITLEYPWNSNQRYKIKIISNNGLQIEGIYKAPDPSETITWLTGWNKRIKITIDKNDVDSELTDFPLLILLTNKDVSFIFDEVGSNNKKIAIATSDGTQCYVEIEEWDTNRENALLWVKVPTIKNTTNTNLYLYYDSEHSDNIVYVGDPDSTPAENVWDNHFKLVSHLNDDPDFSHIRDSTPNDNDGTKEWPNAPIQTDGKIGKAQEFNRIIGDHVDCGTDSSLDIQYTLTIEAWVNPDSLSTVHQNTIVDRGASYWFFILNDGTLAFLRFKDGSFGAFGTITTIPTGTFTHVAVTYDNSALNECKLYINGELSREGSLDGPIHSSASTVTLGDRSNVHPFDGIIDEVRISDEVINIAWIKASYESGRDNLVTLGIEELS